MVPAAPRRGQNGPTTGGAPAPRGGRRSPPARRVGLFDLPVPVVRLPEGDADLVQHGGEVGRRGVPLALGGAVLLGRLPLPGGHQRGQQPLEVLEPAAHPAGGAGDVRARRVERAESDLDLGHRLLPLSPAPRGCWTSPKRAAPRATGSRRRTSRWTRRWPAGPR